MSEIEQEFLKHKDGFERKFMLVSDAYYNAYDWPEMDTLRHEACLCIAFGLNQASITLCNHLLESLLKYSLIYHYSINNEETGIQPDSDVVNTMSSHTEKARKKYGNMMLFQSINEAHSVGLISDNEKEDLHRFRDIFRNAYSHADKKKIFGDMSIPVQGVSVGEQEIKVGDLVDTIVHEMPVIQSIVQAIKAEEDAPRYFLYLDNLVRRMKEKVFRGC